MKSKSKALVFYQNLTPLHMGTGSEIGFVDLPIQREKTTGFPKGEASGIKGAFKSESKHKEWFGAEVTNDSQENREEGDSVGSSISMGSFGFTDARLLFLPVREYSGKLFVWVTCPFVLNRFCEEIKGLKIEDKDGLKTDRRIFPDDKTVYPLYKETKGTSLILEDFVFEAESQDNWRFPANSFFKQDFEDVKKRMKENLYLISDTMFSYFCEMSTEVQTRIRIGENGVVVPGALFEEEFLPEYSILYNFVEQFEVEVNGKADLEVVLDDPKRILQLGGGTTLGKGITNFWYFLDQK